MKIEDLSHLGTRFTAIGWLARSQKYAFIQLVGNTNAHWLGTMNFDGSALKHHMPWAIGGICCSPTEPIVAVTTYEDVVLFSYLKGEIARKKVQSIAGQMGRQDIAWSPDGRFLGLATNTNQNMSQLYVIDQNGDVMHRAASAYGNWMSWNENDVLGYWSGSANGVEFYNPYSEAPQPIPNASHFQFRPKLAGVAMIEKRGELYYLVICVGKKSVDLQTYNYHGKMDNMPPDTVRWSPDGTKLLVNGRWHYGFINKKDGWHVYDTKTGKTETIWEGTIVAEGSEKWRFPAWSPDSRQIIFVKNEGDLVLVTL